MKVIISGADGQLGLCLRDVLEEQDITALFFNRGRLDVTKLSDCYEAVRSTGANIWINCSAYTAVDNAETDIDAANAVNYSGVENISKACDKHQVPLIHISTDYVFDGSADTPYAETINPNPKSIYGISKLKGERSIQQLLANYVIVRTSWLYSEYKSNFVKTMLSLAENRDNLTVVNDQVGSPTYARDLAESLISIAKKLSDNIEGYSGVYHFANKGCCSWFEFSKEIFSKSLDLGLIHKIPSVEPVPSTQFKTVAPRPLYSVLDSSKAELEFDLFNRPWDSALIDMLSRLKQLNFKTH
ncbi:dTDP-4-dehydrorhamnose reductase [Kangiella taiwanensis]|uniref:dTDP-4-dehydrorhamnose reductase n=1 Tax=Kangiella taiwanensis TaxID=1079179 RepID=A0ABP8I0G4_9GAMM|nr:dTDP-4-dehydrorhamnose reductase [Kangiella taiwanensis]